MDPIDRRQLPLSQHAWSSLLAVINPIGVGILKAVFSVKWGTWDVHHVTFSVSLWVCDIIDLFAKPETQNMHEVKLSRRASFLFQLAAFLTTLFILGPGWPWIILILKVALAVAVIVVTLRTSAQLIDISGCPQWMQDAHSRFVFLFPLYRKHILDSGFRIILDAYDCFDAVKWYSIPWALRLAGQFFEERLTNMQVRYKYADMDRPNAQIRLLRIHRQYLFWGHLRCSLQHFSLDNVPEYEALSYRWGFGSGGTKLQYRTIFVDGKTLRIPKSAWELLHARTSRYVDRLVWIDSICINQQNKAEKTDQIPLMDKIYPKAGRTVVWPGDRFDSGMASRMLLRLYFTNYTFDAGEEEFLLFFESEIVRRAWRAMIALFENQYFTRIWCVQEVALGKQVDVLHGNKSIPWDMFLETLRSYSHPRRASLLTWSTKDAMDKALSPNSPGGPAGIMVMDYIRKQQASGINAQALHIGLLSVLCAGFEATEAKDRVFGMNGLIFGSHKVSPNYDLTDSQVLTAASILALKQTTHPYASLVYAGIGWGSRNTDMPSWAVDWSRPCEHSAIWSPVPKTSYATGLVTATHVPPGIAVDADKGLLHVKGFELDTIWRQTSAVTRGTAAGKSWTKFEKLLLRSQWYLDADKMSRSKFECYPFSGQTREEAFWRTVIMDQSLSERPAPQWLESYHVWYRKLCHARLSVPLEDSTAWLKYMLSTPDVMSLWPTTLEDRGRLTEFSALFVSATDSRKFAVTESGLMCLLPPESNEGDIVAVFHGAPTPFLLRKLDKDSLAHASSTHAYQLVGECYVQGFMGHFDRVPGFVAPPAKTFTIY